MHEFSIAEALLEQVRRHTPALHRVTIARVEAGAFQNIDLQSLALAWQALTDGTPLEKTQLQARLLPYQFSCRKCQRQWSSPDPLDPCVCGGEPACTGSADMRLLSLEVEPLESPACCTLLNTEA